MPDDAGPTLHITARFEEGGAATHLKVAAVSVAVIGFLCIFVSVFLTILLFASDFLGDDETASAFFPPFGAIWVLTTLLLSGAFIGKYFSNFRRMAGDAENISEEGEYEFYADRLVASLPGNERTLPYEEMERVERRGDEIFAFYPERSVGGEAAAVVFGLTPDQRERHADLYWGRIKILVAAANPQCVFSVKDMDAEHADAPSGEGTGTSAPDISAEPAYAPEPEKIREVVDRHLDSVRADVRLEEDGTLRMYPSDENDAAVDERGLEEVVVDRTHLRIFRLPPLPREDALEQRELVIETPLRNIEEIDVRTAWMDGVDDDHRDRRRTDNEWRRYIRVAFRAEGVEEIQHLSVGARMAACRDGALLYKRPDDPRWNLEEAEYVCELLRAVVAERWKRLAPDKYRERFVSFRQKLQEGDEQTDGAVASPPPDALVHVEYLEDGSLCLWERPRLPLGCFIVPVVVAAGLLIYAALYGGGAGAWVGGVFAAMVAALPIAMRFFMRNRLVLSPEGIMHHTAPWPESTATRIPADAVARISIEKWKNSRKEKTKHTVLAIYSTKGGEPDIFGMDLPREELEWLKDVIEETLAAGA